MRRTSLVLLPCVVWISLCLSLAGCGDDGGDDGTAGTGVNPVMPTVPVAGTGTAGTPAMPAAPMAGATGGMPMAGATGGMPMAGATGGMPMAGTTGGMMDMEPPVGDPSFTAVFRDIIRGTGCNGGALCHGGTPDATGGSLSMQTQEIAYMSLVNQPAMAMHLQPDNAVGAVPHCADTGATRVVPGQPDMSLLYNKIAQNPPPCGDPMPQTGPLSADQIMQVRLWIEMGAMNN